MAIFKIFYFRPEHRDTFRWGSEKTQVSFTNLTETHALVREFEDTDPSQPLTLDDVFAQCQGEVWSPNGEARGLIRDLGLDHTSMSVGDIIVEIICSEASLYMVEPTGFKLLGSGGRYDDILGTGKPFLTVSANYGRLQQALRRDLDIYYKGFRGWVKCGPQDFKILHHAMKEYRDATWPRGIFLGSAEYRIAVEKQEAKSRKANDHMYAVEVQKPGQYETRTTIDVEAYNRNSAASKARKLGWEVRSVNMIG